MSGDADEMRACSCVACGALACAASSLRVA